jgi:serine/threonine protein kinase
MTWLREANAEPIPGYRLIEPLGSGGFGEVWKCEAPGGMFKAMKFVYGNMDSVDVDGVRAEQEKKALERIREVRHPFVCSLERWEFVNGELIIVMELAERTLHDQFVDCQNAGLIGIPRASLLRYLRDTAEALDFINEKHKLQHLDIKPRNLFLVSERVKVGDFGLVKNLDRQSGSGLLGGVTPLYAPPETYLGKISPHCDQYSLAIVYQELLTGHRPFAGKNVRQLAQQHMQEPPDLRSLPEVERAVIAKALAKNPNERYPSCMALVANIYKARPPVRMEMPAKVGVNGAKNSETIADTMEDILLSELAASVSPMPVLVADSEPPRPREVDPDDPNVEVADMGVTVAQPETGALRPTIVIGLGNFGRKALLELRCRFLDRFGDLHKLPLLRFLCVDPDPEASVAAMRGAPEVALSRNEFYNVPLQPVSNYRRRNLEVLSEWLPREKLYGMPRSLQTQGVRALGRLAFADNQQRLLARLKREIEEATNPDSVYQSVSQTGLALRDNKPRIYVIAAAGGGASGMLTDLGFAIRRLLDQLRHHDCTVNLFLSCGAPQDPASPKGELANIYATLTELNHFSDSSIAFAAQYGVDGQRIVDERSPYQTVYMLPMTHRTPESLEQTVSHLGNYLFHELTTPLGLRLDQLRADDSNTSGKPAGSLACSMRSFGTYSIWFPRGLLLRLAARFACRRLVEGWMATGADQVTEDVQGEIVKFLEKVQADTNLHSDKLGKRLESMARAGSTADPGSTPGEVLAGLLAKLEEQHGQQIAQDDPTNWAKQALNRVRDFVGSGVDDGEINDWRKTKVTRSLCLAAQKLSEQWDNKLSQELYALAEPTGARVATMELALEKLIAVFNGASEVQRKLLEQQMAKTANSWKQVEAAIQDCITGNGGGFRLFGGRSRGRQLRNFMDALSCFAHNRLGEEIIAAVRHTYALLTGRLTERGRDLGFCRQRLRHLHENLESGPDDADEDMSTTRPGSDYTMTHSPLPSSSTFWEGIRQSATARVVLPDGEIDLERAALRFLHSLTPELWTSLDKDLYERVFLPRGGLHSACTSSGDMTRQLAEPLLLETSNFLGEHLPIMDVAQILGTEFGYLNEDAKSEPSGDQEELARQTKEYVDRAAPLITGKQTDKQTAFLLLPASPAGRALGAGLCEVVSDLRPVSVPGQSDLMICREQGMLTSADLSKLLKPCRAAFETLTTAITTSPHARFDILDWLPLDP